MFLYTLISCLKLMKILYSRYQTFKGLPHRFEIFLKKNVTFINDSKATSFTASQLASCLKYILDIRGSSKRGDRLIIEIKKI